MAPTKPDTEFFPVAWTIGKPIVFEYDLVFEYDQTDPDCSFFCGCHCGCTAKLQPPSFFPDDRCPLCAEACGP